MTPVRVTVLDGTGRIGRHVIAQLLTAGHEVIAPVRTPAKLAVQHPAARLWWARAG